MTPGVTTHPKPKRPKQRSRRVRLPLVFVCPCGHETRCVVCAGKHRATCRTARQAHEAKARAFLEGASQ